MAQEAQLGRTPTMPIPKDMVCLIKLKSGAANANIPSQVYTSIVSDWDKPPSNVPTDFGIAFPKNHNDRHCLSDRAFKDLVPNSVANPKIPSSTPLPTPPTSALSTDAVRMPPPPRPGRTATVRKAARTISEEAATAAKSVKIASDEVELPIRVPRQRQPTVGTVKRSADASLARRPNRPVKTEVPGK